MKIVKYLALFVVEYYIQKVMFHLVYVVLKSMVDLGQLIIMIMAVVNHQGLGIPSLQILKSKPELIQSIRSKATQFSFILYLVASLRSLPSLFILQ